MFISIVLPHVLFANERIRADRQRLQRLHRSIRKNELCGPVIVDGLSKWQKITAPGDGYEELLEEWISYRHASRSPRRFRKPGGELRGLHRPEMRCSASTPPGGRAIQASGNANVALKSFDTLQDSVRDYMRNLNRNRAYRGFRAARAGMRSSQRPLDERELVGTLTRYSEEGEVYVERLRTVMDIPEVRAVNAGFTDPR